MQTRSMTRKALSRSSSLEARAASPARSAPPAEEQPAEVIEVVAADRAIVEHVDDAPAQVQDQRALDERVQAHEQRVQAQQHMLQMMQAVHAESHRNTEARLSQALTESEARLRSTAEALVQVHAHEQALETRRSLGEAIQTALVEAHTKAHEQAMQAAHEKLSQFTSEINHKIHQQLEEAVGKVGTEGVAYIESVTAKSLSRLRSEAQTDIDKAITQAVARLTPVKSEVPLSHDHQLIQDILQQIDTVRAELRSSVAESERRCYDEAVSTASAQAERIVSIAEGRLVNVIEDRLANVERRAKELVGDAVTRAETHCNVIEKRSREMVERAILDLRLPPVFEHKVDIEGLFEKKLEHYVAHLPSSAIAPSLEQMVQAAVESRLGVLLGPRLDEIVTQRVEAQLTTRVRAGVATAMKEYDDDLMNIKLQPRVRGIVDQFVPSYIDDQLGAKLQQRVRASVAQIAPDLFDEHVAAKQPQRVRGLVSEHVTAYLSSKLQPRAHPSADDAAAEQIRMRNIALDVAKTHTGVHLEDLVAVKVEAKLATRVRAAVATAMKEYDDDLMNIKLQPRVRGIVDQFVPSYIDDQLGAKLQQRVRASVAQIAPDLFDEHVAAKLPQRVRGLVTEHVDAYLALKLEPRVRGMVGDAAFDQVEDEIVSKLQPKMREIATRVAKEQMEDQLNEKPRPRADGAVTGSPLHVIHQYAVPPSLPQFYLPSQGSMPTSWPPVSSGGASLRKAVANESDVEITKALQSAYPSIRADNQTQHALDLEEGSVINARTILAMRGLTTTKGSFVSGYPIQQAKEPKALDALRIDELQRFIVGYKQYEAQGGRQPWIAFASPVVLQYLRSVECPAQSTDSEIFTHLEKKVADSNKNVVDLERKFHEIKVDPRATSSREKAESILFGVERVLIESNPDVPVATLVSIVVEKLPRDLQTRVRRRMKFAPPFESKRDFAKVLLEEATHFDWPELSEMHFKRIQRE